MTEYFNRSENRDCRRQLRRQMPKAEALLWSKLKNRQLHGWRFRRQYGIGPYIVDFYCPALGLVIELDGESHYQPGTQNYDAQRDAFIGSLGLRILRFLNDDVYDNLEGVWESIAAAAREQQLKHQTTAPPPAGAKTVERPAMDEPPTLVPPLTKGGSGAFKGRYFVKVVRAHVV